MEIQEVVNTGQLARVSGQFSPMLYHYSSGSQTVDIIYPKMVNHERNLEGIFLTFEWMKMFIGCFEFWLLVDVSLK